MSEALAIHNNREQEKELVTILIDSSLYLDMGLLERYRLLHYLMASYFQSAAEKQ